VKGLMMQKIFLWDNDGTITGSKDPHDKTSQAKVILPGVAEAMKTAEFNFIISGFKSPESEAQNFDPDKVAERFISLMEQLPIQAAAFSPLIGGIACYVVIKKDNKISILKPHEDPRYKEYIGEFKKPGVGMFAVMRDVALEVFGQTLNEKNSIMIGDTWHDEVAAKAFGIPFIEAHIIHASSQKKPKTVFPL
jgi:phosphoglycolate phosphatase-like HAD superfamily hydrolase